MFFNTLVILILVLVYSSCMLWIFLHKNVIEPLLMILMIIIRFSISGELIVPFRNFICSHRSLVLLQYTYIFYCTSPPTSRTNGLPKSWNFITYFIYSYLKDFLMRSIYAVLNMVEVREGENHSVGQQWNISSSRFR